MILSDSEKLAIIMEHSSLAIILLNLDGSIIEANNFTASMLGYGPEEDITVELIVHPDDLAEMRSDLRTLATGEAERYQTRRRYNRKDGSIVSAQATGILVRDEAGDPHHVLTLLQDRSTEVATDEALKGSEAELKKILGVLEDRVAERTVALKSANSALSREVEGHMRSARELELEKRRLQEVTVNANVGLVLLDAEARVLYANPLVEDWFGPSSEILGEFCWELFGLTDPETQCAGVEAVRTKQTVRGTSFTKVSRDRELYFYVVATPVLAADGTVRQVTEVVVDITAQKLAEDKLRDAHLELQAAHDQLEERVAERTQMLENATNAMRESEERFRAISESAQDAIIVIEPDSTVSFWNNSAQRMFGYSTNQAMGQLVETLIIPERYRKRHTEAFTRFVHTGKGPIIGSTIELHALRDDRTEFPIELSLSALHVESADWRAVAVIRDITERKQAETAKNLARFTVDAASDALFWITADARIIDVNEAACQMLGYTRDEMLLLTIPDIDPIYNADVWPDHFNELRQLGSIKLETVQRHKDGRHIPVEVVANYVNNDGMELNCAFVRDITERKQAEAALQESAALLRESQTVAGLGTYNLAVASGRWNSSDLLDDIFGIDDTFDRSIDGWISIIHPEDSERMAEYLAGEVLGKKQDFDMEYRIVRVDDRTERWVHGLGRLHFDAHGAIERMIGTIQDITERKEHEEMLAARHEDTRRTLSGFIEAITSTVETRDPYTSGHQRRVATISSAIARELGLLEDEVDYIGMAASVHDLGKIYVPAEILSKPGQLSEVEFRMIRTHSEVGHDILSKIEFPYPIQEVAYQHHERLDGSGYPRGLSGDEILVAARIVAVADVVEAMASHRPYRPALGTEKALAEINSKSGTWFDPDVVDACSKLIRTGEIEL